MLNVSKKIKVLLLTVFSFVLMSTSLFSMNDGTRRPRLVAPPGPRRQRPNRDVTNIQPVESLTDRLVRSGTLDADQVDKIVNTAVADQPSLDEVFGNL